MPNHMYRYLGLGLAVLAIGLTGCSTDLSKRTIVKGDNETTTVIETTDAIKPQKGAAKIATTIENFEGYGWFDKDTIVGYQYASKVFGDDRGLVYRSLKDQSNRPFDSFTGKPDVASLSRDGTKLAVVKEGTGRKKPLIILDLVSGKALAYDSGMLYTPWQFNWFDDDSGAALTPIDSKQNMLSLLDQSGRFKEMPLGYTPQKHSGESYISLGTTLGKRADDLYFLVYSDDPGIYKYNLNSNASQRVLSMETVSQFSLAPKQDYLALTSFKKSGSGSELLIYNLKGEKVYDLFKALNFNHMLWSNDGNTLVFEAIEATGESNLYSANMKTGQTHFLGSYTGYSIKQIGFSPNTDQLMITYVNSLTASSRVDTQILWLQD